MKSWYFGDTWISKDIMLYVHKVFTSLEEIQLTDLFLKSTIHPPTPSDS